MIERQRSSDAERVRRINKAVLLLKRLRTNTKVIEQMKKEYGVSRPQAYRYVQEAGRLSKTLQVPEKKESVMVKLPGTLIRKVRILSKRLQKSISEIITEAIFVCLKRHGAKKEL